MTYFLREMWGTRGDRLFHLPAGPALDLSFLFQYNGFFHTDLGLSLFFHVFNHRPDVACFVVNFFVSFCIGRSNGKVVKFDLT